MAIPEQFLDELTARCDIADVVADYVPLTRKGNNLWGLCPFHGEKTPSFSGLARISRSTTALVAGRAEESSTS